MIAVVLHSVCSVAGRLHSVRIYEQALTNIDIQQLASVPTQPLHFAPLCRCPSSHPVIKSVTSQMCFSLDDTSSATRLTQNSRDAGYANDGDSATAWISDIGQAQANLTLDLNGMRDVLYLKITFTSPRPKAMIIEKSADDGFSWTAMQYYAVNCVTSFGLANDVILLHSTDVQCSTQYSAALPGSVVFNLLDVAIRPNSTQFDTDTGLQRFAQASHLRVRIVESNAASACVAEQYHAVSEWMVTGRQCVCNGHASSCSGAVCTCQHNTVGGSCQECLPLFNNRLWHPGTVADANECTMCTCNNHSLACMYNSSVSKGVCLACQHFTTGPSCASCMENYYRPSSNALTSPTACVPCECLAAGVMGSGDCARADVPGGDSGNCSCKTRVAGRQCSQCTEGYYNLTSSNAAGCQPCLCNTIGTINNSTSCHQLTGQCQCKPNIIGLRCHQCQPGFFGIANPSGCQRCHAQCSSAGCTAAGPTGCVVSDMGVILM